jgi:predicted outer membrane repeat protein
LYSFNSNISVANATFWKNTVTNHGGGIYSSGGNPQLASATLFANTAGSDGGGIYSTSPNLLLENDILWGNEVLGTPDQMSGNGQISYSLVQGGCPASATCANVINADPQFVDEANGDLHLKIGSPAIDAGDKTVLPVDSLDLDNDGDPFEKLPVDLDLNPRVANDEVDMGAFEKRSPGLIYVDDTAVGANDGTSWTDAFTDLQDALSIAVPGVRILVAEGIYTPDQAAPGSRSATFALKEGVTLLGGYPNGGGVRNWEAHLTILSGEIGTPGVTDNSYHVVSSISISASTLLDGFIIEGGNADGTGVDGFGGGMYLNPSNPTLTNLLIQNNQALKGAGMYLDASSPTLDNVAFVNNTATQDGGGMYNANGSIPQLTDVQFGDPAAAGSGNTAGANGGGMYNDLSDPELNTVVFFDNEATSGSGGGMYNENSDPTLSGSGFYTNAAGLDGGGMYNLASSPILTNDINFDGNTAGQSGGGMYNDNSSPMLSGSGFYANAAGQDGGGLYNANSSSPGLDGVTFESNTAAQDGGGVYNENSSPDLKAAVFFDNMATIGSGGGMYNTNNSSPSLEGVTFDGNTAGQDGGGMYNGAFCDPILLDSSFTGNTAGQDGGAMYTYQGDPELTGIRFDSNEAGQDGGAMHFNRSMARLKFIDMIGNIAVRNGGAIYERDGDPILFNVIFSQNKAIDGGGLYSLNGNALVVNATFWENAATDSGGGLYLSGGAPRLASSTLFANTAVTDGGGIFSGSPDFELDNSILWGNKTAGTPDQMSGNGQILHSLVQGGCPLMANCPDPASIIDGNPQFVDEASGDLRLKMASPAIDAGDKSALPADSLDLDADSNTLEPLPIDLDDRPRVAGSEVDMGAFESPAGYIYVDDTASGANNGTSWTDAFNDLQDALSLAVSGVEIWVAEGIYTPEQAAPGGRGATFQLKNGVKLYGGFEGKPGTEGDFSVRNWSRFETILSGEIGVAGPADNSYHVVTAMSVYKSAVLDGFIIEDGNADGGGIDDFGGGLYLNPSSPTLANLLIRKNQALKGAGMYLDSSSPSLAQVTFTDNAAGQDGAGMYNDNSSPKLFNVVFEDNIADQDGGGLYNMTSSPPLTNVVFKNNIAVRNGGGLFDDASSGADLVNVTLFANEATTGSGGGIYTDGTGDTNLTNVILWHNRAATHNAKQMWGHGNINFSLVQDGCLVGAPAATCADVIEDDPLFVEEASGDLRLVLGSPAIDVGDNNALPADVLDLDGDGNTSERLPVDLAGHTRIANSIVDLGAYESPPDRLYVDHEAQGLNDGSSWTDAFTDLQRALGWALDGVQIWVAEGTYKPSLTTDPADPQTATFTLPGGVELYGGFEGLPGTEGNFDARDLSRFDTYLSGDIGIVSDNTDNSYHVLTVEKVSVAPILDGFIVTGGNASKPGDEAGGGLLDQGGSPNLANVTFLGNRASWGGGMYVDEGSPTLDNVTFRLNTGSSVSEGWGGGLYLKSGNALLTNVIFDSNRAFDLGGAIYLEDGTLEVANGLFWDNSVSFEGGAIYLETGSGDLVNVTFSGNESDSGAAIFNDSSSLTLANGIVWGNSSSGINPFIAGIATISYSLVEDGCLGSWTCNQVFDQDPLFVEPNNLHLQKDSPAIDAGDNVPVLALGIDEDLDARIWMEILALSTNYQSPIPATAPHPSWIWALTRPRTSPPWPRPIATRRMRMSCSR